MAKRQYHRALAAQQPRGGGGVSRNKIGFKLLLLLLGIHVIYMLVLSTSSLFKDLYWEPESPPREPLPFDFHDDWHPRTRAERFPSVQERVKLYMSNWYHPPCLVQDRLYHETHFVNEWPQLHVRDGNNKTLTMDSIVDADVPILLHGDTVRDCARTIPQIEEEGPLSTESRVKKRINLQSYCSEVVGLVDYMEAMHMFTPKEARTAPLLPLVAQFGDNAPNAENAAIPLFAKWRAATTTKELADNIAHQKQCHERTPMKTTVDMYTGLSPIVWKLEMCRHWDPLEFARQQDLPWEKKKLGALWRGDFTGRHEGGTEEEVCVKNQRCQFVLQHANSNLVDAGLSDGLGILKVGVVNGIQVLRDRVTMEQIQEYKVIVSMEGNDVASGLKWSLLSTSVVIMPAPTRTSWAMEELLEPWVHYIPMHESGSNLEELITWVGNHDTEAQRIGERGRLFIYDLLFHPDAARDEQEVKAEIARRYRRLWQ